MKYIIIFTLFINVIYADFEIKYKIDNKFEQTAYYKDKKHVLFNIKEHNKSLEDLIILNSKKYIRFTENGIERLYEIEDDNETQESTTQTSTIKNYTIVKKIKNIPYLRFNAQVWKIKYKNNQIEYVVVTDDKDLLNKVKLSLHAIKNLLPPSKQDSTSMFIIDNKYVILQTDNLILQKYSNNILKNSLFNIHKSLNKKEQLELSKNIDKCFYDICCGNQDIDKSKYLTNFLKNNSSWKLKKVAQCKNSTQKDLESAIFKKNNRFVTVELVSKGDLTNGKVETLKEEGVNISNIQESFIDGFKVISAYLPIVDASVLDIELPNTTISLYTKGKFDLLDFSKKVLLLRKKINYTLGN